MTDHVVAIASDHAGIALKETLIQKIQSLGYHVRDLGPATDESVDYPDFAQKVTNAIYTQDAAFGILICGTGIGMSIAANRHKTIRAALCHNEETATLCRQHNNANVLVLGARVLDIPTAEKCAELFLTTAYEGGRHERRLQKIS